MKLKSVKIVGDNFRSLTENKLFEFNTDKRKARMSTKCFAGLNGSGKSNMLEVLAEIFYFLDYYHLEHGDPIKKQGAGFGFEIEYLLPMSEYDRNYVWGGPVKGEWMWVRIVKPLDADDPLEFNVQPWQQENTAFVRVDKGTEKLLPNKIVAYSSGQNELLSNCFYKLKYHYFREAEKHSEDVPVNDRMFFIDKVNNFNVFIANMLLGTKRKTAFFHKAFDISGLHSFRITINKHIDNKPIDMSATTITIIDKLKSCATAWSEQKVYGYSAKSKRSQYVFDFLLSDATKEAFAFHFDDSAMELFQAFYQLEMQNSRMQKSKVHNLVHNANKDLNISEEIPEINADERFFRIERILLNKNGGEEGPQEMKYRNLSDGEHQFNEVIGSMMLMDEEGCLLLYDEPDTHFNPKWRASIISLFNEMAATEYDSETEEITAVRNQEVIITTHSPFAISDSFREDVYCFEKREVREGEYEIFIDNPQERFKTYGASITSILEHVFKNDQTIANLAYRQLEKIREDANSPEAIEEGRDNLSGLGESIEKFNTLRYLRARENEMRK